MSEWFSVNPGLRQGCVMCPWLFNIYMDGVVRELNVRVLGKRLELLRANGGRLSSEPLVVDSEEKLCRLVIEFGRACERRKLRVKCW